MRSSSDAKNFCLLLVPTLLLKFELELELEVSMEDDNDNANDEDEDDNLLLPVPPVISFTLFFGMMIDDGATAARC